MLLYLPILIDDKFNTTYVDTRVQVCAYMHQMEATVTVT